MNEKVYVFTEDEHVNVEERNIDGRMVLALSTVKFKQFKEVKVPSNRELIEQIGEVRMATTDQILSGEATEEDIEVHNAAGKALVRLLEPKIETIEDCKHELIDRYSDGRAECCLCGAKQ